MEAISRALGELPTAELKELLKTHGLLKIFALWWTAIVAVSTVIWYIQRRNGHKQLKQLGIPGPEVDSTLFGHYYTLKDSPIDKIREWTKQFGSVFGYYIGETPFIALSDADIIRDVFVKSVTVFDERPPFALVVYPISSTLLCLKHDIWKARRSVLTPAFSAAKLKLMMNLLNDSSVTLLQVLKDKLATDGTNKPICLLDMGQKLTLDVIARCALATKINCLVDDKDKLLNQVREFLQNTETFAYHLAHGLPRLKQFFEIIYRFTPSADMMIGLVNHLNGVIKMRRKSGKKIPDMLQLMMEAADSDKKVLNDEDVAANSFLFLIAGYETTAITIANMCYFLAKYPEEQEKLVEEIREVCDAEGEITYEQTAQLKRVEAFVLETLRHFPPVISMVARLNNEDFKVGQYTIPKGTRVQASVMEVHMNETYWPEPEKFIPDRFMNNDYNQNAFLPFGIGPKMCIGKRFSLMEMKVLFAQLLRAYRLDRSPLMADPPKRVLVNVSLIPEGGVPVHVVPRV